MMLYAYCVYHDKNFHIMKFYILIFILISVFHFIVYCMISALHVIYNMVAKKRMREWLNPTDSFVCVGSVAIHCE